MLFPVDAAVVFFSRFHLHLLRSCRLRPSNGVRSVTLEMQPQLQSPQISVSPSIADAESLAANLSPALPPFERIKLLTS